MPGVLIIEAMAQAAGILAFVCVARNGKKIPYIILPVPIKYAFGDRLCRVIVSISMPAL